MRRPASLPLLSALASLLPAAACAAFVARLGVDVPNWDEWSFVPFLQRVAQHETTLGEWLAPHNQHLILFLRAAMALLAQTVGWNLRYEMAMSIGLSLALLLVLTRLTRETRSGESWTDAAAPLATSLLLFSLTQWESWLWGMQCGWFFLNLCAAGAILLLRPERWRGRRGAAAIVLCAAAAVTASQGLFVWLAVLPLLLEGVRRQRVPARFLGTWVALAALLAFLLAYNVHRSGGGAALLAGHPVAAFRFFLVLVGAPLATGSSVAEPLGAVALVALIALGVRSCRKEGPRLAALPWCSLALYGLLAGAATAAGRANMGLDYALTSHYTTNTVLVWVGVWHLARLALGAAPPLRARAATATFLILLGAGLLPTTRLALDNGDSMRLCLSAGKSCLDLGAQLEPHLASDGCLIYLWAWPTRAQAAEEMLAAVGARPRPQPPALETSPRPDAGAYGGAEPPHPAHSLAVTGWTLVDDAAQPPLVLISRNDGRTFLAAEQLVEGQRPSGARVWFSRRTRADWRLSLRAPRGATLDPAALSAWRFDPRQNRIVRLPGPAQ